MQWGQGPHLFELRASDERVLARASLVFRPWTVSPSTSAPIRSWTVARRGPSGPWEVYEDAAGPVAVRDTPDRAVTAVEFLAVQALYDRQPDVLALHAALVARAGIGVLICGPSEAGKSTLACALWRRGYSLLGDDTAIVDTETLDARPAPRRVALRSPSRALLGSDLWTRILAAPASEPTAEGCLFHPDEVDGNRQAAVHLAACVFLARRGAETTGLVAPLPAAQAALALLPYTNLIRRLDAGALIGRIGAFAAGLPAYDMTRAPLAEMAAAVERLLDARTR